MIVFVFALCLRAEYKSPVKTLLFLFVHISAAPPSTTFNLCLSCLAGDVFCICQSCYMILHCCMYLDLYFLLSANYYLQFFSVLLGWRFFLYLSKLLHDFAWLHGFGFLFLALCKLLPSTFFLSCLAGDVSSLLFVVVFKSVTMK